MELKINTYQIGEQPIVTLPDREFYKALGEAGMRKMVKRHYDLLRESGINHLFPPTDEGFEQATKNSGDFMIQICGGPAHFNQNRGKPMLAARHRPFQITMEGRNVWLTCYKQALLELEIPENLIFSFWNYINVFSIRMVNTE